MEAEELKKYSLLSGSLKSKIPLRSLILKKTKLVRKSHIDIMVRRKKREAIKELRKFRDDEMKKIENEVAGMKRDLLAYMLKELEDQKKVSKAKMEDAIEDEKRKRLEVIEFELSRSCEEKGVQTNTITESSDMKFDEILDQLREVKHSSTICKNILMKSNYAALFTGQGDATASSLDDSVSTSSGSCSTGSNVAVSSSPGIAGIATESSDVNAYLQNRKVTQFASTARNSPARAIHKQAGNSKNMDVTVETHSGAYTAATSLKSTAREATASHNRNISFGPRSLRFPFGESVRKLPRKMSVEQDDDLDNLFQPEPHLTSEKSHLRERRTFGGAATSEITMVGRDASPYQDIVIMDEHNLSSGNMSMVSPSPSYQDDHPLYEQTSGLDIHDNETAVDLSERITIKEEVACDTPEQPTSSGKRTPVQISQQDTATYIRNLLSSDKNLLPSTLSNSSSNENITEENTAAYIKKLLISTQLSQPEATHSTYNAYINEATHKGKPTSENTALYIKNLLLSSPTSHTTTTTPKTNRTAKNPPQPTFIAHSIVTSYTRPPEVKQTFGGKRRSYARRPDNTSYNIYTHNKRLISSQEKRTATYLERGEDELKSQCNVRKKRELNKRIYEKYGPLKNHKEIADLIQTDPMFLSLSSAERSGLLSCLNRSVAEHLTLSKDLLEELFSREVLSISSCKGSPIKTALNPEKLSLIRKIVFLALPSHDEKALWEMIQDSIDTKCRGILRNMKKKLTKRNIID